MRSDLGLMIRTTTRDPMPPLGVVWALDNECYTKGDQFDERLWLEGLERFMSRTRWCLFAVAPDVVGDALATLFRARPYLGEIASMGYVPAFVSQDGCRSDLVPWAEIGCLFVGGTTEWKLSEASWALCREAKRRGLWVHVGRVNSWRRLKACAASGVDSVDGTHLAYTPDIHVPEMLRWLDHINAQLPLEAS